MPKQQKASPKKRSSKASKPKLASKKPKNSRTSKPGLEKASTLSGNAIKLQKKVVQKEVTPSSTGHIENLNFESLVHGITHIHEHLISQATKAINVSLTLRNWLIGCYIREYELGGSDRAVYGERLLEKLAEWLRSCGIKRADERELRRYRQLYLIYPQIREALSSELSQFLPSLTNTIRESLTPELYSPGLAIVEKLSFTHLVEMIQLEDPLKRTFYEIECMRGNWSVRELKRQIASLYYERSGLSKNKKKISQIVQAQAEQISPSQIIRDPYIFDFLGIKARE